MRPAALLAAALVLPGCELENVSLGVRRAEIVVDAGCGPDPCSEACGPSSRLLGIATSHLSPHGTLVELDPTTGEATELHQIGTDLRRAVGMTYAPDLLSVYAVAKSISAPELIRIDPATGEVELVGTIEIADRRGEPLALIDALAYNPCDGYLYATGGFVLSFSDLLLRVHPTRAVAEIVGSMRDPDDVDLLEFVDCELLGGDAFTGAVVTTLYWIDLTTAEARRAMAVSFIVDGLAWDPVEGGLMATTSRDRTVLRLDLDAAGSKVVGQSHTEADYDGKQISALTFVPRCPP